MTWTLADREPRVHFLIHDHDAKFTQSFDTVFQSESVHVILTPFRAANDNAFAKCWVRTVRHECLDKPLILNQAYLARVLGEYVVYYIYARPHQGLDQQAPIPWLVPRDAA